MTVLREPKSIPVSGRNNGQQRVQIAIRTSDKGISERISPAEHTRRGCPSRGNDDDDDDDDDDKGKWVKREISRGA